MESPTAISRCSISAKRVHCSSVVAPNRWSQACSSSIRPEEEILIGRSFRNQEILSASIIPLKESGAAVLSPLRRANEGRLWGAGANQGQPDLRAHDRRVC